MSYRVLFGGGILDKYNEEIERLISSGNVPNSFVMEHTYNMCMENDILKNSIENTNKLAYMVKDEDIVDVKHDSKTTNIIISSKRSFEAASAYKGKKIAVLNFANNHNPGGSPWTASAQEEALCRLSTLYPCLRHFDKEFYEYHIDLYRKYKMDEFGNADIIYLPNITVFKSDDLKSKVMDNKDWYNVDIITSAAPNLSGMHYNINKYKEIMYKRIEKIIQIAKKEGVEVLILGAFGCGVFHNPPEVVASIFKELLGKYHFDIVEFAIYSRNTSPNSNYNIFKSILEK